MSGRYGEERCVGKAAFRTRWLATRLAKRIARDKGEDVHVYRCQLCGLLHIGHLTKWNKQEWEKRKGKDR